MKRRRGRRSSRRRRTSLAASQRCSSLASAPPPSSASAQQLNDDHLRDPVAALLAKAGATQDLRRYEKHQSAHDGASNDVEQVLDTFLMSDRIPDDEISQALAQGGIDVLKSAVSAPMEVVQLLDSVAMLAKPELEQFGQDVKDAFSDTTTRADKTFNEVQHDTSSRIADALGVDRSIVSAVVVQPPLPKPKPPQPKPPPAPPPPQARSRMPPSQKAPAPK
jgi:hypothetical protein